MAQKKSVEQLLEEAKRAEARAKELRQQAQKQTRAEQAREDAALVKAVRAWAEVFRHGKEKDNLVALFQNWKTEVENRQRNESEQHDDHATHG
jgi:regulator of replication initiation timing